MRAFPGAPSALPRSGAARCEPSSHPAEMNDVLSVILPLRTGAGGLRRGALPDDPERAVRRRWSSSSSTSPCRRCFFRAIAAAPFRRPADRLVRADDDIRDLLRVRAGLLVRRAEQSRADTGGDRPRSRRVLLQPQLSWRRRWRWRRSGRRLALPMALIFCFDHALAALLVPAMMVLGGTQRANGRVMLVAAARRTLLHPIVLATILGLALAATGAKIPGGDRPDIRGAGNGRSGGGALCARAWASDSGSSSGRRPMCRSSWSRSSSSIR